MRPGNIFLYFVSFLFLLLLIQSCKNGVDQVKKKKESIKPVKAFKIKGRVSKINLKFPGVIKPSKEVKISFRIGGPILRFSLETGEYIKKGELIAKIDQRDYLVKINGTKAKLEAAKAGMKDAELQYERYTSLYKQDAIPKAQFDQIEAAYVAAKSNTRACEKELEAAENSLFDTNLTAPFTGYVNKIFTEKHETVAPGQPVISLIDLSRMEVETFIPENLVSKWKDFKDFSFCLTAFPQRKFPAVLKEIGREAAGAGQTYPLTLSINGDYDLVKPGMSAMAEFSLATGSVYTKNESLFDVPISAIIKKDSKPPVVWKIQNRKALPTEVNVIEILDKRNARVTGNLMVGDLIVTSGSGFVNEGQMLEIVDSGSETNIGNEL